jgi:hypothetical protein
VYFCFQIFVYNFGTYDTILYNWWVKAEYVAETLIVALVEVCSRIKVDIRYTSRTGHINYGIVGYGLLLLLARYCMSNQVDAEYRSVYTIIGMYVSITLSEDFLYCAQGTLIWTWVDNISILADWVVGVFGDY